MKQWEDIHIVELSSAPDRMNSSHVNECRRTHLSSSYITGSVLSMVFCSFACGTPTSFRCAAISGRGTVSTGTNTLRVGPKSLQPAIIFHAKL